ncbi:MAG: alpha/beta hydrolase [Parvibaculaceae bacterium]|nr:alpha/beta hydrolase [Parvibaculaceae bacterium]
MSEGYIETSHGRLAYRQTDGTGPTVLFIHGNSACKEVFNRQTGSDLLAGYRLITLDLPGHGASSDAPDPQRTYSIHGFADAVMEALEGLGVSRAVIVGWSLGGHAALEMAARWPGTRALWVTGTPPVGNDPDDMGAAFLPSPHMELTFKERFTQEDARLYAQATIGGSAALEPWMMAACYRADGRFRPLMLQSAMAGGDVDGRKVAETSPLSLAVVSGEREPFISNEFLKGLTYRNLWDGQVHVLPGLGHMPFWEAPELINPMLKRFLDEVTAEG